MPRLVPIKRSDFIVRPRRFDFEGPFPGGRHEFMIRSGLRVTVPNPHHEEISVVPGFLPGIAEAGPRAPLSFLPGGGVIGCVV